MIARGHIPIDSAALKAEYAEATEIVTRTVILYADTTMPKLDPLLPPDEPRQGGNRDGRRGRWPANPRSAGARA